MTKLSAPRTPFPLFWRMLVRPGYNLWDYMEQNQKAFGDICRMPYIRYPMIQVSDPDLIGKLLMATEKTNQKSSIMWRMAKVTGRGLIFEGGERWKKNRKLANPAFHPRMIDDMREIVIQETKVTVDEWKLAIAKDPVVNLSVEISKLSLRIILRILFTDEHREYAECVIEAARAAQDYTDSVYFSPFDLPLWLPTPLNRKIKKSKRAFHELTDKLISEHKAHPEKYTDLLSVYLSSIDQETGARLSDEDIRDEILTLILAGHETTATTLAMCISALIEEPPIVDEMLKEYAPIEDFTKENTKALPYTALVLNESLRLYPVVWGLSREIQEPMEYKGEVYRKGTIFVVSQQLTHRHPKLWDEPLRFLPERFLPENSKGRHPFAYFPFGGGVRNCIGTGLAKMETQIILAALMKNFRFEHSPENPYVLKPMFTVVPSPSISLKVFPRS